MAEIVSLQKAIAELVTDKIQIAMEGNACVLPTWTLTYVCEVPGGAHPSYTHDYYARDNAFCKRWDAISKDRVAFEAWVRRHILSTSDFAEFRRSLQSAGEEESNA